MGKPPIHVNEIFMKLSIILRRNRKICELTCSMPSFSDLLQSSLSFTKWSTVPFKLAKVYCSLWPLYNFVFGNFNQLSTLVFYRYYKHLVPRKLLFCPPQIGHLHNLISAHQGYGLQKPVDLQYSSLND